MLAVMNTPLVIAFRHRSSLVLAAVFPVVYWTLTSPPPAALHLASGALLLVLGAGLRLWAARCLGKGARVHTARARGGVVDWGPYRWSRNPLYVAAGLILTGLGLLAGGGWVALLLLPATCLVYAPVVAQEERAIRASEGAAYSDYLARVPRWVGLPARARTPGHDPYPWRAVLRREAGLMPGLTVGALGVVLVQRDVLPARAAAGQLTQLGVGPALACAVLLGAGAAFNSALLERKHRRRRARREALETAEERRERGQEVVV